MTECERIVKDGIVPEEFLREETRCDFLVDSTRKKIWTVELDLIRKFDEICKKNNLTYYLAYGSLLGAVRHKGFIPWDDDFDVMMLRKDYEALQKLNAFESPYFLQTPQTDPNYAFSFARFVNDNTTFCSKMFSYQGYHAGICIDIFPLDSWDMQKGEDVHKEIKRYNLENSTYMRIKNPHLDPPNKYRVQQWSGINPLSAFREINRLAQSFTNNCTDYIASSVSSIYPYGKEVFPKQALGKTVSVPFENLSLPIPVGYDAVLSTTYGNYKSFPPVEKRGTWHKDAIIDPDSPYSIRLQQM